MSELVARELTPPGRGAVAVLSLEGAGALERARSLCPGLAGEIGRLQLVRLHANGEPLDEALVVVLSPEQVELHLHGSPPLVRRVLSLLEAPAGRVPGAELALEDLAAEGLAAAPCEAAARILLDQQQGALRAELEAIRAAGPAEQDARLDRLLESARVARRALAPARVVLAGPVNAGKSTLFNAVVGAERALVSAERGTTRDVVRERARLGAWPIELCDAPGERASAGAASAARELELAGLRLARELAREAELVVWLSPAPGDPIEPPRDLCAAAGERLVAVTSCADRLRAHQREARRPWLSALCDPAQAAGTLEDLFRRALGLPGDPWSPGAPVPFEPGQCALLTRVRASPCARERGELLARLLAPAGGTG